MSNTTLSGIVDAHLDRAGSRAEQRMTAADAARSQATARIEEARGFVRPDKQEIRQLRAAAMAQGKQLRDDLLARGAQLKAGR
ncbi:hypothetical protein [Nocardia lijiangensis]|uniref:hypothetical protein n=1 Tax=Nocardia lijiangensis TaxID=299618 RepID=UPI0008357DF5|nr:hypothetical protein [Nocardia lijiangensis]